MPELEYLEFDRVDAHEFMIMLNRQKLRVHLIEHDTFDECAIRNWMDSKIEIDAIPGCRVRAICCDKKLIGWCGIQRESDQYELALVIDDSAWGIGRRVFTEMMKWAQDFGHKEVYIHLLHTRRENRFLRNVAKRVYRSEMYGNTFTTYQLAVK